MPDPMRIAILSVHSCPTGPLGAKDTGGMSVYIRELAREMGRHGHTVDVYTRIHDSRDPQIVVLGQSARLIHLRAGADEVNKLELYSYLPEFASNLEDYRKNNGLYYDLIFSHYWLSGQAGEYLRERWGVPHVAMFHTLGALKNDIGIGEDDPELRLETERYLAQHCPHIIATTKKEREYLIERCGAASEGVSVHPCGVNLELFQTVEKQKARQRLGLVEDKIILYIGRIEPLKGIDQLLKALPLLQDGLRPRLVIIGGDNNSQDEVEKLQSLAGDLAIEDLVTFSGLVKQEELPYFYSAADVCVIPSHYESFGLVALESLACGTPVVAADVGDLKSIIRDGENGYVVRDNSPHRLAQKIAVLLNKSTYDIQSALLIRASVSRFSWSNIAEEIIREFQQLLAGYPALVP